MKESEDEVNTKYFQIQKIYFGQNQLFLKLLDAIEKNCNELVDSIPGSHIDMPKPIAPEDLDFEKFRAERKIQDKQDHLINRTESLIVSACPDLPESARETLIKIRKEQDSLNFLKNDYNTRAMQHNAYIKRFPRNYYSSFYHFHSKPYYNTDN